MRNPHAELQSSFQRAFWVFKVVVIRVVWVVVAIGGLIFHLQTKSDLLVTKFSSFRERYREIIWFNFLPKSQKVIVMIRRTLIFLNLITS